MYKEGDIVKGGPWDGFEVIDVYTRAQAIEDGVLIDVTSMAKEAGFRFPVAVTRNIWAAYIVPDERSRKCGQSEEGRLWDVLWMLRNSILKAENDTVLFKVYFIMKERQRRLVTLKALCSPGDEGEPVITIMGEYES
jgi:hypothetical protein